MKIHDMESHPAADIFPMMVGAEFDELKKDIEENGLEQPIVLDDEDRILDGRNRYKACCDLGLDEDDIAFVGYEGEDPVQFVISLNLKRRHLNESQRAMVGAKARELYDEEATERMKSGKKAEPGEKGQARDKAAAAVNVSGRSVTSATKVLKNGCPKMIELVEAGRLAVDAAKLIADRPHEEQEEILDLVASGTAKSLRHAVRMHEEAHRVAKVKKSAKKKMKAKVLHGDCLEVLAKLRASSAHVAVFDPPYGVDVHTTHRAAVDIKDGKKGWRSKVDYSDGEAFIRELFPKVFEQLSRVLVANGHGYCFAGYSMAWLVRDLLREHFFVQDNPIIWVKDNFTLVDFAQTYAPKHEYIWHFKQKKSGNKRKLLKCVPDVIECARSNVTTHSAEKPVELLKTLIEQSSDPGETIIDPFCGSGSTLVAAVELKRNAVGIELDEKWHALAESRVSV
jgi:DNA modification methylase